MLCRTNARVQERVKTLEDFAKAWHVGKTNRGKLIQWINRYLEDEGDPAATLGRIEQALRDQRRGYLQKTEGRMCVKDLRDKAVYNYASGQMLVLFDARNASQVAYV